MFTRTEKEASRLRLYINGRIDTETAPLLREAVQEMPDDITDVIIDFRDVTYISSAGLRDMIVLRKQYMETSVTVENVSPEVYAIFETTGFDTFFLIRQAPQDAVVATYVHLSFKDFLKRKVAEAGEKVVLKGKQASYTWEDLDKASQIMADDLAKCGVTKGAHVGLCGLNSINWIIAFYAIQKLGAITMLINPNQKAAELANVAKIGDVTFFCYGKLPEMKDEQVFLKDLQHAAGGQIAAFYSIRSDKDFKQRFEEYESVSEKFAQTVEADDACVMIFTSGSTGRPKGVLLSAYNILNAAGGNRRDQTIRDTDKTCLILPLFHIFGLVAGLFANGIANATICIPKDIRTNTLLSLIEEEKCTFFHSVPTMLIALINNKDFVPEKLASLRGTIISGAAATEAQIRMFKENMPRNRFMASYGLSEMAPVSITDYEDSDEHVLHTVGRPVEHIQIRICDAATKEECPVGVSGEIYVRGFNLMVGYYKVPIEDQSIDDEGWLHTGDLGFMDEDGYLHLSGRLKELIIRGGENIMPGEVEAAISELDIIDNVKVIGVPSEFFGEEVGACVKLKDGAAFDEEAVKEELKKTLAKFKVPSRFLVYDEFPMLGTGKIDGVTLKADALKRLGKKK